MFYTFRSARRQTLAQLTILILSVGACRDTSAPSQESPDASRGDSVLQSPTLVSLSSNGIVTTGTPGHPNEPIGFVQLNTRPFNSKVENGWRDRGDWRFSIAQDGTAPISPNNVGKALFPAGWVGGSGPINTWYKLGNLRKNLYMSFWVKMSSGWQGHRSGVNKILYIQINNQNMVFLDALGSGNAALRPEITGQGMNENPVTRTLMPNVNTAVVINRGQWVHWEVLLTANTNGLPNGAAEWWVNGVQVGRYSNINYVPATGNNDWEVIKWNPVWGGVGDTVRTAQNMTIDDFYVSNQ